MMKMRYALLSFLFFSSLASAEVLKVMEQRLVAYKETRPVDCSDEKFQNSSHALKFTVGCSYKCNGGQEESANLSEVFSPEAIGLSPGNGSGNDKIIWSSLNIGLKTWSEKVCLDQAALGCKGISEVQEVSLSELRSGDWKLDSFPKCKEKKVTVSPFDNNSKAEKFYKLTGNLIKNSSKVQNANYSFQLSGLTIELPINDNEVVKCSHKIVAKICFGDCIDMSNTTEIVETLATPEPFGEDTITICGDDLYDRLKSIKTTKPVRQLVCENYFWTTIMKGQSNVKTCAAIRGDVDCSGLEKIE